MNSYAERLKGVILALSMSESAFARAIGVKQATLNSLFKRGSIPRSDLLDKVVTTFAVNPKWLLTGAGSMFLVPRTSGGRLEFARTDRRMSIEEFAEMSGTLPSEYLRYETDMADPSNELLERIEKNLGINKSWIMSGDGEMDNSSFIRTNPWSDKEAVNFAIALPDTYKMFKEYQRLKFDRGSSEYICGKICDTMKQLSSSRQIKLEGYAEGLLREQQQAQESNE